VERGRERLDQVRPIAERHGLTPLQLACAWNLAHPQVECVVPTLIEEPGGAKPIEAKREELAGVPAVSPLSSEEVEDDPRDRRQPRLDGAQGRHARPRGARRSPTAGRSRESWRSSRALEDLAPTRSRQGTLTSGAPGGVTLTSDATARVTMRERWSRCAGTCCCRRRTCSTRTSGAPWS
jgi:hypothetical protein